MALTFLLFLQSGGPNGEDSSFLVPSSLPPTPTCVVGTSRIPFLCRGVCQGSGTSWRSGQDAGEVALELVDRLGPGYYSRLYLVKRALRGRGWHPVIDVSSLNGYVIITKFKMETISSVLWLIRKGDYIPVFSIDLKNTYFQIPFICALDLIFGLCSEGRFTSSRFSALAFIHLLRSSPVCLLWYQCRLMRGGFDSCAV